MGKCLSETASLPPKLELRLASVYRKQLLYLPSDWLVSIGNSFSTSRDWQVSIGNSFSTSRGRVKVYVHTILPDPACGIILDMLLVFEDWQVSMGNSFSTSRGRVKVEKVAKKFNARFVINIGELGEEDPLVQNATLRFPSVKIPWYSTRALRGRGVNHYLKQFKFAHGSLDIIVVDTGLYEASSNGAGDRQSQWLIDTLENSESKWCIAVGFHPLVACEEDTSQTEPKREFQSLDGVFLKYGVDAYISGPACANDVEERPIAKPKTGTARYKGPLLTKMNRNSPYSMEKVNGFLLHKVSALEIVSYLVTLEDAELPLMNNHQNPKAQLRGDLELTRILAGRPGTQPELEATALVNEILRETTVQSELMKVGEFSVETKGLFGHEIRCHEVNGEKDFLLRMACKLRLTLLHATGDFAAMARLPSLCPRQNAASEPQISSVHFGVFGMMENIFHDESNTRLPLYPYEEIKVVKFQVRAKCSEKNSPRRRSEVNREKGFSSKGGCPSPLCQ
ncbi:putative two-component response regulator ARR12-like [Capsicum annuum]|nr:putative two-component response regulator ARR12-like [Capsicum annuum]